MSRSRLWKRWRNWALVFVIFALGIPALAASVARSSRNHERLQQLASRALQRELGLTARLGSAHLELLPPALVARDIVLDDPVYGRFAEAELLRIRPSFRSLLRGELDIDEVEIHRAEVRLVVRDMQVRNLPRAEGPEGGGPPELPIEELRVLDSSVTVDIEPHATVRVEGLDLTLRGGQAGIELAVDRARGWVRHRNGREVIEEVSGQIALRDDVLVAPSLQLRTPELTLRVDDGRLPLPPSLEEARGAVRVRYDLEHLARLPLPEEFTLPALRGILEVEARMLDDRAEPTAAGSIALLRGGVDEFGLGEAVRVRFEASPDEVRILEGSTLENLYEAGEARVAGTIGLDPSRGFPVEVSTTLEAFSFAALMNTLGVTDAGIVEWIFEGTLALSGTLDPLVLEGPVRLQTHDFVVTHDPWRRRPIRRVIGVSRAAIDATWSIREDAVRFEQIAVAMPRSRLRGDLLLGFDNRLRVRAQSEHLDLADVTPLDRFPLAGIARASVDIRGLFQEPVVTGELSIEGFVFDDFRLGRVEANAVLDPDGMGVRFPNVRAEKNASRYRMDDLYLDFHRDRFEMTGMVHFDGMDLADLYHVFGFEDDERFAPYEGIARGRSELRYTNGFPDDSPSGTLTLDMDLGLDRAVINDFAFTDGQLAARFRWLDWSRGLSGAELDLAHFSARKGEGTVNVQGRLALGGRLALDVVADRLALRDIEGIGDRLEALDGIATATGRVGGTVDVMQIDLDVGLTDVVHAGQSLGDARAYVRMTDRDHPYVRAAVGPERAPEDSRCLHGRSALAQADWPADPPARTRDGPEPRLLRPMAFLICGQGFEERLQVDLAIGRAEALPVRGQLRFDDFDVGAFLPRQAELELGARVSGAIAFAGGAIREPETLAGELVLDQVRLRGGEVSFENDRPVELTFGGGALDVRRARFIGPDSRVRVRGRASVDEGLSITVLADTDLAIAARLSPAVIRSSGRLSAQLTLRGEVSSPEIYGEASVERGSFVFSGLEAYPIDEVGGQIRFSERSVLVEGFSAETAGGRVELSGAAELGAGGLERFGFDVEARELGVQGTDGVDVTLGARARLAWTEGERLPTLSGELRVTRFEYGRPIELRSLGEITARMVRGAFRQQRTEVRRYAPEEDRIALDLAIVQQAPFRVRNNLVDAELRIDLTEQPFRLVGTDQRYGVLGSMSLTSGRLFFQNNEFDVRRGAIRFDDTTRIDPHLDVEAITEVRRQSDLSAPSWRVVLNLSGSPDNLRLATRSEPDLPEQDILMLLAFGMTRGELAQLQEGDFASAAALEALTSMTGVDQEVRRALPVVDDLRITTGYSMRTGRSEPRLSVGKRIADRIRLSASSGLGEAREFLTAIEWQLDQNTRLQVSYDNFNVTGANSFGNLGFDWGYRLEFE